MKTVLNLGIAILVGLMCSATANELATYQWKNRPVLVFADSADDPRLKQQMRILNRAKAELFERDIIVFEDASPLQEMDLRKQFKPSGFLFVLVGKDGGAKLKSTSPVTIAELITLIDAMPMRLREMREQENN